MKIDISQRRKIEHPARNDAPISHNEDRVWTDALELFAEFRVGLKLLWLGDRQIMRESELLHRRRRERQATALRAVRLSHN